MIAVSRVLYTLVNINIAPSLRAQGTEKGAEKNGTRFIGLFIGAT